VITRVGKGTLGVDRFVLDSGVVAQFCRNIKATEMYMLKGELMIHEFF
jgi:hypothetical protein